MRGKRTEKLQVETDKSDHGVMDEREYSYKGRRGSTVIRGDKKRR